MNFLLFRSEQLRDDNKLSEYIAEFAYFVNYPGANDFIQETFVEKDKISIAFYHHRIFMNDIKSMLCAESANTALKDYGELKKVMVRWNLYETFLRLDKIYMFLIDIMIEEVKKAIENGWKKGNFGVIV